MEREHTRSELRASSSDGMVNLMARGSGGEGELVEATFSPEVARQLSEGLAGAGNAQELAADLRLAAEVAETEREVWEANREHGSLAPVTQRLRRRLKKLQAEGAADGGSRSMAAGPELEG